MICLKKILAFLLSFSLIFSPLLANEKTEQPISVLPIPNKYEWNTLQIWENAREKLHHDLQVLNIYQDEKQSKTINFLKSIIMPGWGHLSAREYTRGEVLLGLEIFAAGSAIYFYDKSQDYYSKYKKADNVQEISQYYTDANTAYQNYQALLALMIFVWGYSAFDSFRATSAYNARLWDRLSLEYKGKTLQVQPFKLNVRF